ncbi:nucleotidyltransferase domain-containing protein [Spirosoma panaciterrae]|uniref:nucleotidyltransferase domain-containing protein n=1 Tax=Spirosoma panaciterrae TaxID=496058 RepID=UPI00035FAB5D|nr:nucleotidyltransferase family protein [Spirosoma panaciterrae]
MAINSPTFAIQPEQILLLKAALFPAQEALSYWHQWKKERGLDQFIPTNINLLPSLFDPLDGDSQRLMPLVYRNLEKSGDPLVVHLRGIYRYTWMSNQRFLLKMSQVIRVLHQNEIETIALKGIPLSLLYYGDMGVRLMYDLDVLVPTAQAEQALQALQAPPLSLQSSPFETKHRHTLHAMHLWDANGVDVDLHWNLLYEHSYAKADVPFWQARQPVKLTDRQSTYALSPTHQLYHNLVHGYDWSETPAIRWIADSYVIYTNPALSIDWHALLDLARQYNVNYPVQQALKLLESEFRLTLPSDVKERLKSMTLSTAETTYFSLVRKRSSNKAIKAIRYVQKNWLAYRLFRKGKSELSMSRWMYRQVRLRLDWNKRDLPF